MNWLNTRNLDRFLNIDYRKALTPETSSGQAPTLSLTRERVYYFINFLSSLRRGIR
jgi:hypothetical protein